jgi:hypothetical protein
MNDDPRYVMAMKGFASPKPYDNFVSVYKFTVSLYIFLYKYFPAIGWYGLSMFLLLWGALFNIYLTLYLAARKRMSFIVMLLMFIAFFFLIFFQNVYLINFTRPAILASASFIMLLAVLYLNSETLNKNKWVLIFPILTYVLAHLTRLDAGHLGFAFGTTFTILLIYKQKKIIPFLIKYISPVLCFILLLKVADFLSQKNNTRNHDFLEKTEILRKMIDYRNTSAYVPYSIKDSVAWYALMTARYCNDDKIISTAYLKMLTRELPVLQNSNDQKFKAETGELLKSLKNEASVLYYFAYGTLAVMFIWLIISVRENSQNFIIYILFQLFCLALILSMSYYMKLPARIHNPILVLLTFGNIIFLFSYLHFPKKSFNYILLIPAAIILFILPHYLTENNKKIDFYKLYCGINQSVFDKINNLFSNTIFIPTNLESWEIHRASDPLNEISFKNKNCYVYLSIELSMAPETKDQLIDKFGTSDHANLFKKISEMNNVVFISDEQYNMFLRAYYYYLYNQNYYFEKIGESLPSVYKTTTFGFYRLKKYHD